MTLVKRRDPAAREESCVSREAALPHVSGPVPPGAE